MRSFSDPSFLGLVTVVVVLGLAFFGKKLNKLFPGESKEMPCDKGNESKQEA